VALNAFHNEPDVPGHDLPDSALDFYGFAEFHLPADVLGDLPEAMLLAAKAAMFDVLADYARKVLPIADELTTGADQ
jgi:hypothetical protein